MVFFIVCKRDKAYYQFHIYLGSLVTDNGMLFKNCTNYRVHKEFQDMLKTLRKTTTSYKHLNFIDRKHSKQMH